MGKFLLIEYHRNRPLSNAGAQRGMFTFYVLTQNGRFTIIFIYYYGLFAENAEPGQGGDAVKKTAAVTGASGGIGLACARALLAAGYEVYALNRTQGPLDGAAFIRTDVADPDSVRRAFAQIEQRAGRLDLLVVNAGFGISGAAEYTAMETAQAQFSVNFFGAAECCRAALPLLRKTRGRIINISSVAAVYAIPFQAMYSASKAALNAYTCALALETAHFGVSVCAVLPGDVKTGFTQARQRDTQGSEVYGGTIEASVARMERDERQGMAPERIAAKVVKIAKKRRVAPFYSVGAQYKLLLFLGRLLPHGAVNWVIGKMYVKRK